MTNHLTREQLLHYLDGELPKTAMRATDVHLQSCWACRTELEHLQEDIGIIHDAQKGVLLPGLPPPPRPWPRLEPRLAEARRPRVLDVFRIALTVKLLRPVPLLTVLAGLFAVVALLWFSPPSVSAKEVLRRVSEADAKRMAPTENHFVQQKVRVTRTRRGSTLKEVGQVDSWRSAKGAYWRIARSDAVALNLQRRFRAQNVPDLPLSAVSYQSWSRDAGGDGGVTRVADTLDVRFVTSRTSGPEALQSMNFWVRPADWHVVRMDLDFTDVQFEVAEEELTLHPRGDVPPDVLAELAPPTPNPESQVLIARNIESKSVAPVSRPSPDLDDIEMDVRYTLHQVGADLGDPIEVVRNSSGQIVVRAWAAPSERQQLLKQLLQNRSSVQLELQPPTRKAEAAPAVPLVIAPAAPVAADRTRESDKQRLSKWFGSSQAQEDFTRSVLTSSTELLARLYALKQLADRWPSESRSRLSSESSVELATMVQDNSRAARQQSTELRLMIKPLLDDFAEATDETPPASAPNGWQDAAARALGAAKDVDRLLRSVLTTSASGTALNDGATRVRQGLAEMEREIVALAGPKL